MSKFVPSRTALHAGSEDSSAAARPPTRRYENTYHTDPDPGNEFSACTVKTVCQDVLTATLDNVKTYDANDMARLALKLTATVKQAVKELNFPRYKFVVQVLVGENRNQGFQIASRCVWNDKLDSFACAEYKSDILCAVVIVHGIYYE